MSHANISIVRALNGLGDFICVTPALRAIRAQFPDARISYIGLSPSHPVAQRFAHLVDRFVAFPGFPGIPEHPFEMDRLMTFLDDLPMQAEIDLAIQLHGNGSVTNSFVGLLGARRTAGFHLPHLWCPDAASYLPYPAHLSEPERWLALAQHLGAEWDATVEFPVLASDRSRLRDLLPTLDRYAVLHPGASQADRRWQAADFALVGDALARRGLSVVITGIASEAAIAAAVAEAMTEPAIDVSGATDLGAMAALIEGAELVVTNDTGVSHLAAATRTPSVIAFIGSDPARWAPVDRARHRAVGGGRGDPIPGGDDHPSQAPPPTRAEVLAAVDALLETTA